MDRSSVVGVATAYGLDGLGTESRRGRDFPHPSRPALGPTQPPVQWALGIFHLGVKRAGCDIDHPPLSSTEVKERVEQYLYSPFVSSLPVIGRTLPYFYLLV